MDFRRILIILLLLFFVFGDKIDLTKFDFLPIMSVPEIVKPDEKYVEFSKSVSGKISNFQDRINLSIFCDSMADEIKQLELKKPRLSQMVDLIYSSFKELYSDSYKDKYQEFTDKIFDIPKIFSEENDRILSQEEILEMSWYFKGLAWNIVTK